MEANRSRLSAVLFMAILLLVSGCFGAAAPATPSGPPTPSPLPSPTPRPSSLMVGDCVDTDAQAGAVLSTVNRFNRVDCSEPTARYRIVSIIPAGLSAIQSCPDTAELSVEIIATTYCLSSDLAGLETPKLPYVKPGECLDVDEVGTIINSFHTVDCSDATADARVVSVIPFFGPIGDGVCPAEADTWIDVSAQTISGSGRRICIANI